MARQDIEPAEGDGRDDDDAGYEDLAASFPADGEWDDNGPVPPPGAAAAEPATIGLDGDYESADTAAVPF